MTASGDAPLPHTMPSGRLPGLDMLRGIAALCVVGLHVEWIFGVEPRVFAKGFLAVDLFFMLSGYVMARTYEPRMSRGLAPMKFFWARYRRLWPVMVIGSLIGLPKLLLDSPDLTVFAMTASLNLLLLPLPSDGLAFPLNIPAWSILLELTANLVHALVLWRLSGRYLLALAAITLPLTIWAGLRFGDLDFGAHTPDYLFGVPRVLLSYLIGIALFRRWQDAPPFPIPPALSFAAMPAAIILAWSFGFDGWLFDLAVIVLLAPLLIAGALHFRATDSIGARIALGIGALSFPLYAVHMPVLQGMQLLGFGPVSGGIAAMTAGIAVTLAVEARVRHKQRTRVTA